MRSKAGALWRALASVVLLMGLSAPVRADVVPLGPAQQIFSGPGTLFQAQVAFDEVNQVYLVVWGTFNPQPCLGIVLNAQGQPITAPFAISDGQTRSGWARVSAGGGRFLVTYTKYVGGTDDRPVTAQMARFVTVNGGVPQIASAEIPLDALGNGSSDAGTVYVPAQNAFLATWWKWVGVPQSFVRRVNIDGSVGPIHQLTDGSDGQSDPEIACDTNGTCLAVGFAWDSAHAATKNEGASWSRLIDAATGAPVAALRYLDVANRQESQSIAFNAASNRYNVAWVRTFNRVIGQAVDTAGNPLGLYSIKTGTGGNGCDFGFGQISASLTYNPGSGTLAIGMTDWCGLAYIHELDSAGLPMSGQFHQVSGLPTNDNQPAIAANAGAAQFLFIHNYNYVAPRARLYQANATGNPNPNPNPNPTPLPTIDLTEAAAPNGSWFLAEGVANAGGWFTYYLVSNENDTPVSVRAFFANEFGAVKTSTFDVPARSRYTIDLGAVAGHGAAGAVFQSLTPGADIFVERSIYFGPNFEGSTLGTATKSLSGTWQFAEGSRGGEYFANYFLLFNPTQGYINVDATFFPSQGGPVTRRFNIGPQSRFTVNAGSIDELAGKDFSSTFTSTDGPFIAERAMYWGNPWHGGTASMGATGLATRWLFAEGVANSMLETFYLILNPNDFPIEVTATYFPEFSSSFSQTFTVDPKSRYTVYLNGMVGEIGPAAAEFTSQANFLAERSIYWGNRVEGSNVIGVNTPAMVWSLPEGGDGGMFDTYTLIANPNFAPVQLDVTFYFDDDLRVTVPEDLRPTVPARGRLTMDMSYWLPLLEAREQRQLVGRSFSTRISVFQQTGPIVVEHALYWNFVPGLLWRSGGASVGIPH
jgi:hypothetical protein